MRTCPRCTFPLDVVTHHGTELDHCRRCGGTFLDPGEETQIFGAVVSPEVWEQSSVTHELGPSGLKCPQDRAQFITYAVEHEDQSVEVDLCKECSAMWLDAKEGRKLRDIVMKAGQTTLTDLVSDQLPSIPTYLFQLFSGLPIEVWNPKRKHPTITISLILTLYGVFAAQLVDSLTGGVDAPQGLIEVFGLVPARVLGGSHLWTLITSAFLHGGIAHIFGNTYFFYVFGDNIEDILGKWRFLFIYFFAAAAGSIVQVVFQTDPTTPVIGASGAVAGLMGAYIVLFSRVKLYLVLFFIRFKIDVLWYIGFWVAYNVIMALAGGEGIAWMAHIGGFLVGALIAFRYRLRPLIEQLQR